MTKIVRRTRRQVYALWIKALRSGEYKQGKNQLRSGNRFCCLGVLCDLARKDGGPRWDDMEFMGHQSFLPTAIQQFVALSDPGTLAAMNDGGKSFRQIAAHIEQHVMPRACKEPR